MTSEERERLDVLCGRIQKESDPNNFTALLIELNHLLAEQDRRIAAFQVILGGESLAV